MNRRSIALALALIGAAALAGCGDALDPYPTVPRTKLSGLSIGHRIGICYNRLATPLAAVQTEAQQECAVDYPHTVAEPAETDWLLQNCPLLLPERANFVCAAKK